MSSEGGNLVFYTGSTKNIEFRTGSQGRIKLNEEDLADVFSQIQRNKDEILELKRLTNTPLNLSSEIIQLQSQIVNIEDRLYNLELTFFKKACNSNPCQNSGTCINLLDAFFCLCPNNWQGPDCSVDVNECQIYEGTFLGCQNGATCINKPGNYSCICTPETYGQYCTSEFDDCQGGSSLLCGHGVCVDGNREQHNQPSYTCICDDGWMSPPGSLACNADIDECSLPNPPCSVNPPVRCINMRGFYFCDPCPAGYEGDGKVCTLINICSVDNGGCHPLAVCNNISGTVPNCVCPDGYTGNGYGSNGCFALSTICQTHNPCVNGQCLDTAFGYNCECDPGWIGINCSEKIGECSRNPCYCGGGCITGVNGYTRECKVVGLDCSIKYPAE
ncbi:cubilin-like [Notechis scutatus]|uniref:Cubilin-like n=1 Tax=Notechis scutatus TaxID=8663 RepID=A0A6J1VGH8_9SAUR|nr:cubilin-like [Notechis scutatus]